MVVDVVLIAVLDLDHAAHGGTGSVAALVHGVVTAPNVSFCNVFGGVTDGSGARGRISNEGDTRDDDGKMPRLGDGRSGIVKSSEKRGSLFPSFLSSKKMCVPSASAFKKNAWRPGRDYERNPSREKYCRPPLSLLPFL